MKDRLKLSKEAREVESKTLAELLKRLGYKIEQINEKALKLEERQLALLNKSQKIIYVPSWADDLLKEKVPIDKVADVCEIIPSSERQDHTDSIIAFECHGCGAMFTVHISDHNEYKKLINDKNFICPECRGHFDIEQISLFKFKWFRYWRGVRRSIKNKMNI